jgi:hypothetical protein
MFGSTRATIVMAAVLVGVGSGPALAADRTASVDSRGMAGLDEFATFETGATVYDMSFVHNSGSKADTGLAFHMSSTTTVVPEPASIVLIGLGLAAIGARRVHLRRRAS